MTYYIDLFSPETYETFTKSNQDLSGFRLRQEGAASRILGVTSPYFKDNSPCSIAVTIPI